MAANGSTIREADTEVREIFSLCWISFSFAKYSQEPFFLRFDGEGGISFLSVFSLDFQSLGCFLKLFFLPKACKEIGCFHHNLLLETCNLYFPQCLLYLKVIKNNSTSK